MSKPEKTKVIFRKFSEKEGGGVIALFPTLAGDMNPGTCSSFMHVGQHGSADLLGMTSCCRLAFEDEYGDLKAELERAPYEYDLQVAKRATYADYKQREAQVRR